MCRLSIYRSMDVGLGFLDLEPLEDQKKTASMCDSSGPSRSGTCPAYGQAHQHIGAGRALGL